MRFCYKDTCIDWRLALLVFVLCGLHAFTIKTNIANITALIEAVILLLFLVYKRLDMFLLGALIILITTFEFPMFVDSSLNVIPSIVMLPIVKGYFFLLLSLCPIFIIFRDRNIWNKIYQNRLLLLLAIFVLVTLVFGFLSGLLSLFTDNTSLVFRVSTFFKDIRGIAFFNLYTLYFIYACLRYREFVNKLEIVLFSSLVAIIFFSFVLTMLGIRGDYEGQEIILMPLSFFFSTSILFFLLYKKYTKKYRLLLLLLSCMAYYMQFAYSNALNGKSWLVILYICLMLLWVGIKKYRLKMIGGLVVVCFLFPLCLTFFADQQKENSLSFAKFSQALSLISVIDVDWYDNLPLSPKIRIEEFLNTCIEYQKQPYYFLMGKGFSGGHQDYRASYGTYNPSAFSLDEYNNNYFTLLHESLNVIFLKFGLIGIALLLMVVFNAWKYMNKSPWLIIGSVWLLLFWGYSFSLMFIGLSSLVVGLNYVEE